LELSSILKILTAWFWIRFRNGLGIIKRFQNLEGMVWDYQAF